ncbi:MaoC/PaaZ C-terminal domain-containing protein [Lacisediminihabitans sp. FW035]
MSLNLDLLGTEWDAGTHAWSSKDALLYALGVGAGADDPGQELQFTTENSAGIDQLVLPTFAVTLSGGGGPRLGDFGMEQVLHAEQSVELYGPLPVAGMVSTRGRVIGYYDKGRDALIEVENVLTDQATGAPLARLVMNIFVRGEGGFSGDPGPRSSWVKPDEREPDVTLRARTRTDQALLYRLSGDRNPLHSDPSFAARAGFDRPILHGLCSYGMTGRLLLAELFDNDVSRFGSFSARFASIVHPGDELVVQVWKDDDGASFIVTVGETVVLNNGRLTERREPADA